MSAPVLEVRQVRKSFAGNLVLRDVDLAVEAHRVAALIGRASCRERV